MEPTPAERACPNCGERFAQSLDVCPKCGRDSANPFVSPVNQEAPREEWRWIAAIAMGICLACGALAFPAPGLAVLLFVLASPILVRAWAVLERRREAGLPIDGDQRLQAITMSGLMLLLAALAGAIAFAVVCVPLGFGVALIPRGSGTGMIIALGSGGIAALTVGVYVMIRYWPKRIDKPDGKRSQPIRDHRR